MIHWFYPSSIVGCGLNFDDLDHNTLACARDSVTCPRCIMRLVEDKKICARCATNNHDIYHRCDPGDRRR
jgi:hypothetical protein